MVIRRNSFVLLRFRIDLLYVGVFTYFDFGYCFIIMIAFSN